MVEDNEERGRENRGAAVRLDNNQPLRVRTLDDQSGSRVPGHDHEIESQSSCDQASNQDIITLDNNPNSDFSDMTCRLSRRFNECCTSGPPGINNLVSVYLPEL